METVEEIFHYLPENHIVVCKPCRIAIVPQQCETHLKMFHIKVSIDKRKQVANVVHNIHGIAHKPEDVIYPGQDNEPYAYIPVRLDGLRCAGNIDGAQCLYVWTAIRAMRSHCANVHGWVNEQRRGGNAQKKSKHTPNRLWNTGQSFQQIFKAAGWKKYIPIRAEQSSEHSHADDQDQRENRAQKTFAEYLSSIQEARA